MRVAITLSSLVLRGSICQNIGTPAVTKGFLHYFKIVCSLFLAVSLLCCLCHCQLWFGGREKRVSVISGMLSENQAIVA